MMELEVRKMKLSDRDVLETDNTTVVVGKGKDRQ